MCRYDPITKTERRCPSYLDRASYNAKRRARYKEKRTSNAAGSIVNSFIETANIPQLNNSLPIFNCGFEKVGNIFQKIENPNVEPYKISDECETNQDLNINVYETSGAHVDLKYFNDHLIQGKINYTNLNSESYKHFFAPVEDGISVVTENYLGLRMVTYSSFNRSIDESVLYDPVTFNALSSAEVEPMTEDEKKAVYFYSTDNYEWFNEAIYSDGKTGVQEYGADKGLPEPYYSIDVQKSKANAKRIANLLDSALAKRAGVQRTLYRGISSSHKMFQNTTPEQWTAALTLGQELKFDGYQSTSVVCNQALSFTNKNGVLFEILTPEGVQISNASALKNEKEVLLPRDSRYMVVGVQSGLISPENSEFSRLSVVQLVAINNNGEILDGTNHDTVTPLTFKKVEK